MISFWAANVCVTVRAGFCSRHAGLSGPSIGSISDGRSDDKVRLHHFPNLVITSVDRLVHDKTHVELSARLFLNKQVEPRCKRAENSFRHFAR